MYQVTDVRSRLEGLLKRIELCTGQEQLDDGRRSVWRYEWTASATVRCLEGGGSSEPMYVTTSHISPIGLNFRCSSVLETGQKVMVVLDSEDGDLEIPGRVMHSTGSVGRNIIGVKFELEEAAPAEEDDQQITP